MGSTRAEQTDLIDREAEAAEEEAAAAAAAAALVLQAGGGRVVAKEPAPWMSAQMRASCVWSGFA